MLWTTIKQSLVFSYIGLSLYGASFVASLLLGYGADHPVLGPLETLSTHIQAIILSSIGVASSVQLGNTQPTRRTRNA